MLAALPGPKYQRLNQLTWVKYTLQALQGLSPQTFGKVHGAPDQTALLLELKQISSDLPSSGLTTNTMIRTHCVQL